MPRESTALKVKRLLNLLPCLALIPACTSPEHPLSSGWATSFHDRRISRFIGTAVDQLALGPDQEWNEIASLWSAHRLDGMGATCFLVGLGELFARAPTVFLERHLAGDPVAKELAREGYGLLYSDEVLAITTGRGAHQPFDPKSARSNALNMFRQRKSISDEPTQKKIEEFILFITKPARIS